jgi:hypothetical protein
MLVHRTSPPPSPRAIAASGNGAPQKVRDAYGRAIIAAMRPLGIGTWMVLAVACGASSTPVAEPARGADAPPPQVALVEEACERCRDVPCFREARGELDALDASMGGIDELPPSAHRARERFESCALAYSDDVVLRIEQARTEICGCADSECVQSFVGGWDVLREELATASEADRLAAEPARGEAEHCLAARSIAADRYLAIASRTETAMCRCDSIGCAESTLEQRATELGGAFYVAPGSERAAIHDSEARTCECLERAFEHGVETALGGLFGVPVQGSIALDCADLGASE